MTKVIGEFLSVKGTAPRPCMLLLAGKGGPVLRAALKVQYAGPVTSWPLRRAMRARGRRLGARDCVPGHPPRPCGGGVDSASGCHSSLGETL